MTTCRVLKALESTDTGTFEIATMVLEDEEGAHPEFAAGALEELSGVLLSPKDIEQHREKNCSCFEV